jgi:hypothetical protein
MKLDIAMLVPNLRKLMGEDDPCSILIYDDHDRDIDYNYDQCFKYSVVTHDTGTIEEYIETKYVHVGGYLVEHADTSEERHLKYQLIQENMIRRGLIRRY